MFRNPLLLSNPSSLPHSVTSPPVGSRSCVCGSPGCNTEQSVQLAPDHRTWLPYKEDHLLVVVSLVVDDFLFCFA